MFLLLALLIGVVAGLRSTTAPAAVSWGAWLGWLPLGDSWASFMGHWLAVAIFTIARAGRVRQRPAAVDAEPQGAAAVRRAADRPARCRAPRSALSAARRSSG